ncbi:lysylphosphatidylglycerol synthase domain-containing protein [Microvirga sp. ACRRW]|uniref:lysylphosphatidylglycerol synthase domain-containing protein n=1 Tax=Microvirga sp. ACRRW TaxID=2918205 RepID=UPI001EF63FF1|nr:lysylphosphatidylglycerol synthase domain-containing protein [Microvirga sp. ACRRW]MCG7394778.1 lysylphosphatidylglycerol synthase domain-containing protein [Microvirga sp. ACRRW]
MNDMSPHPVAAPDIASAEALHPKERRSRRFAWIGMAASVILFGASLVVLWHIVSEIDVNELKSAFTAASLRQIGLAVLFTTISYSLLTCYDAIALRQLKLKIPYLTTAMASFTSYAVSFTLGFPLLTAGTVRYWIYSPKGLSPGRVASLTVITGVTFWLGMALVLAWSLIRMADELASLVYTHIWVNQLIGLVAAVFVAGYLVWVSLKRRSVRIQGWKLELPGLRLSLGQILIGAADVCAGAGVLFVLLPGGHGLSFETFLAVYIFAVMLGVASHAPGGLGVFEATILLALSSYPREPVLGALLLYRLCYYLVPFVLALALLGAYEVRNRLRSSRGAFKPDDEPAEESLAGR